MKKKNGLSVKIGYGLNGEYPPDRVKGFFASSLKRLGEPKYDVNLREIFSDIEKTPSRVKKAITHVMDKVTTFLARYNKTNRTLRKLARSFDIQG